MTISEIILSVLGTLMTSGFIVAMATVRSTVKTSKANAQSASTDANEKLMKSYEDHIVNPILKSNERTNRKLDRLSKAIERIPSCSYAYQCPVSSELQKSGDGVSDHDHKN